MQLYYTPRSHFARKVRIIADALSLPLELIDVGNLAASARADTGDQPLHRVPVLVLPDGREVFESDHIAQVIVRMHDPEDRFGVLTTSIEDLNVRSVLNGIMAIEVELLLAGRMGLSVEHPRFDRMRDTMSKGLVWLSEHEAAISAEPTYSGFHLVCMWEHVALYDLMPLREGPLRDKVRRLAQLPYVDKSRPI